MKKLFFASALVLMGSYGYAQSAQSDDHSSGTESSLHGSTVSDLAQSTTVKGKAKGSLISSAARAKALTVANANARFLRGDSKPTNGNANASVNASTNANANAIANANVNSVVSSSSGAALNGKPATLPPVSHAAAGLGHH